jgi:DNA-binding IclR family transcriptional regulator
MTSITRPQRQGIQSLEIGVRLLQEIYRLQRPATLQELAALSRMHPAKVHRYCVSLVRTGLVQQNGRGLYGIGPYRFQLIEPRGELEQARALACGTLRDLVREIGETAFLSAWGQTGPVILDVEEPQRPISVRPTTRGDLPLHNSATGRVFAAFMPQADVMTLVDAELAALKRAGKLSERAATAERGAFLRKIAAVRKRGLARTTGERYPGLVSFAAPIFGRDGRVILSYTCFGLAHSLAASWTGPVPLRLLERAAWITQQIGGRRPTQPDGRAA